LILSTITINGRWDDTEEMLIPVCIGEAAEGFGSTRRMDRMLPIGHRYHAYEG
jgi:hypothetical protein